MGEQAIATPAPNFRLELLEVKRMNNQIHLRITTDPADPDPVGTIRTMLDQVLPGNTPPGPE